MEAVRREPDLLPATDSMLILPLLLFWVKAPMHFSKRMLRAVISSVFIIALVGPVVSVSQAEQPSSPAPDVFLFGIESDTTEMENFFSDASRIEEIFDEADREPMMASDAIAPTKPSKTVENPQKLSGQFSGQFSAKRSSDAPNAEDALKTKIDLRNLNEKNPHSPSASELSFAPRSANAIGDGVFVPPTQGRFQSNGGTWTFTPDDPNSAVVVREIEIDAAELENTFRVASTLRDFRKRTQTMVELVPGNPLRNGESEREHLLNRVGKKKEFSIMSNLQLTQLIVADNLMLQRVVDAIRLDNESDRWIVSGVVTRDDQAARIEIRTARPVRR